MKHAKGRRSDKEDQFGAVLDFAANVHTNLASDHRPPTLATDLYKFIDELCLHRHEPLAGSFRNLDELGTKLWNLSSKLKKDDHTSVQLVCLVRVFACLLLDCAQRVAGSSIRNAMRVFRSALKTTRLCLDQGHVALAERVVEKAAYHEDVLTRQRTENHPENSIIRGRLSMEYCILRIALAWKQDRLDLAEITLTKLDPSMNALGPILAEDLADLLFEIGKDLIARSNFGAAVQWLEKAHDLLISHNLECLSSDVGELQLAIMHSLVKALIHVPGEDARRKASSMLSDLDARSSDRLVIQLLKLDLLSTESTAPDQAYFDVLLRIVGTVHVSEPNLKTIMHHVHKLRPGSPGLAHCILQALLLDRLVDAEEPEWVEKVLVTIIWNAAVSTHSAVEFSSMKQLLTKLKDKLNQPIGASATHAAQMLLWKQVEAKYNQEDYVDAESWCHLALDAVFDSSGELNKGKLQRKLILIHLAQSDYTKARNVYFSMSDLNMNAQETKYLMYKVALRSQDSDLASECLGTICNGSAKDVTLLYACVLEAQQSGHRDQAIAAMQRTLDKDEYGAPPVVHLPALLRCTARLLIRDATDNSTQSAAAIDGICKLFEGAAAQAKNLRRDKKNNTFSLPELDWFSRNSYNLALRSCTTWKPRQTWRLLQTCLKFIDLYPKDIEASALLDLSLRRMFCDFLGGSLLIVMARGDDQIEDQLQHYLGVRKHAQSFRTHVHEQLGKLEGAAKKDLLCKSSTFLAFDFEAAVRLKAWEDMGRLIETCREYANPKVYETLADITLSSEASTETIITSLQQIVNITWQLENNDISKLSRWIRCLFQLALTSKAEIANHLLDQVVGITENAKTTYPPEELEWLATTTFNRAVDFYCMSQDDDCQAWAGKALSIARLVSDGGSLHGMLQTKYAGLSWDK